MLHPIVRDGVRIYVSPLLQDAGVPHAFSTRIGGISEPPFDSMNLGNPNGCSVQDLTPNIAENYRLLQRVIGCEHRERCYTHQVHGGEVLTVPAGEPFENNLKADGLVTADPTRLLSIRTADCVPVLLASRDGRVVGAAHAGWRGVIARVVPNCIAALLTLRPTLKPTDVLVAIGPSISGEAFEVGPEVLAEFERSFPAAPPIQRYEDASGKGSVDRRNAIRQQLIGFGVAPDRIDSTDRCTVRDRDELFSHRRDHGITGRMAALISPVTNSSSGEQASGSATGNARGRTKAVP
jgi:YfiH family protein